MARPPIAAHSDQALNCYHQTLCWKIGKEDWGSVGFLFLQLKTKIPGSSGVPVALPGWPSPHLGGCVSFGRGRASLEFLTQWPKDVNHNKIRLDAVFFIKLDDGSSVRIKCDEIKRTEHGNWNRVSVWKKVRLDPELLYDAEGFFTIEAELMVDQEESNDEENPKKSDFVKDIGGIFSEMRNSIVIRIL